MAAYVLKRWAVSNQPNANGNYIEISGRRPGFVAWLLSMAGIEATVNFAVSNACVTYSVGSLSGIHKRIIPVAQISSMYYGFSRPWRECGGILLACLVVLGNLIGAEAISPGGGFLLVLLGCMAYYALNKRLSLGIQEAGALSSGVEFKRSVIEGKRLDEADARIVCDMIAALMAAK
jgi:hypothetical protein